MARKLRILFVKPSDAPFILQDIEILRRHFDVRVVDVEPGRGLGNKIRVLVRLKLGVIRSDVAFCWFAEIYSKWAVRFCRLFGKKSVVVIGGYETAKIPEIGYGSMLDPEKAKIVQYVLDRAHRLLPVSEFVRKEMLQYSDRKDSEVVHNAVDTAKISPNSPKQNIVVTVGNATMKERALKGIDAFAAASKEVPEAKFVVIGETDKETVDELKAISPKIHFTGKLSHDETLAWLDRAKVYCQLSKRESFGMALAEAMALECVPVVTGEGALPEIVGKAGTVVSVTDPKSIGSAIRSAIISPRGNESRMIIIDKFSIEKREDQLMKILDFESTRSVH